MSDELLVAAFVLLIAILVYVTEADHSTSRRD